MIRYIFLSILISATLVACTDDDPEAILSIGDASVIISPNRGSSFVLQEEQADQVMTMFRWSPSFFGFSAAVNYTLQIDMAGNNFNEPSSLLTTTETSASVSQSRVNGILLGRGVEEAIPVDLEVRVVASVSDHVPQLISNPIPIRVTPFIIEIVFPQLQVPGSYQGWDPSNNNTVIFSRRADDRFEGFVFFQDPNTEFKFTVGPSWDINYGDDGANGTLDRNGANIVAAVPGMYRLNVNLVNFTYTILRTTWGVIGSATPTGWDSDTDMVYNASSRNLEVEMDLVVGELKFRANDDWAINFGDNTGAGFLDYDGANIQVTTAGRYRIELILQDARYAYRLTRL